MKAQNLNFRVWDNEKKQYLTGNSLEGVFLGLEIHNKAAVPFLRFADSGDFDLYNHKDMEVELWTGLKDKNGIEIYDGDIVKVKLDENSDTETLKVLFANGHFGLKPLDDKGWLMEIEVIGNIHENPELIQGINNGMA